MGRNRTSKPLRDLRPQVYRFPEPQDKEGRIWTMPMPAQFAELGCIHGFPPDFDLPGKLEGAWTRWRELSQLIPEPTANERREFLRQLAQRADQLREAVAKLGSPELSAIYDRVPSERLALSEWGDPLMLLSLAARDAARDVVATKTGRRGDPARRELMCRICWIYREAFGDQGSRLVHDPEAGKFVGKLFDFANDVAGLFGVQFLSNAALGRAIQNAQAIVDRRISEGRLIPKPA